MVQGCGREKQSDSSAHLLQKVINVSRLSR